MSLNKQRGELLMESLIGMVLMAVIGGGVMTMTANVSRSHGEMNLQSLAITQMRSTLIENGYDNADICSTSPSVQLPGSQTVTVTVRGCVSGARETTSAVIVDENAVLVPVTVSDVPAPILMQASSDAFSGDIVVGGSWD